MKTKTFNISLPKALADQADSVAKSIPMSRSELMRGALRAYLERRSAWQDLREYGAKKARELGIKNEQDVVRIVREERKKYSRQ
jgi:metal-responsive CopG/Arc/MetJ family transcriptional regulator